MSYANPLLDRPARGAPRHVGVIGAGSIGPDIAYYLKSALPGLKLTLIDIRQLEADGAQHLAAPSRAPHRRDGEVSRARPDVQERKRATGARLAKQLVDPPQRRGPAAEPAVGAGNVGERPGDHGRVGAGIVEQFGPQGGGDWGSHPWFRSVYPPRKYSSGAPSVVAPRRTRPTTIV